MKRLLFCLLIGWTIAAAMCGCRTSQPTEPGRDYSRSEGTPYTPSQLTQRADTPRVVVQPHRSLVDKLIGRTPKGEIYTLPTGAPIRTGKKASITIYQGPATVTTNTAAKNAAAGTGATSAAKADAPVATGSATATDNTKAGQRGGAAATGAGASATATTEKQSWLAAALPWVAGIGGVALAWWLFFGGGLVTIAALWRKNKPSDTQA